MKRFFPNKLGATSKKSPEDAVKDILDAAVAWIAGEILPINVTTKIIFRRILDQINSHSPKFDARTILMRLKIWVKCVNRLPNVS